MLATIPIAAIIPGNNDRRHFAAAALQELADSIRTNGLAQPPTVVPHGNGFQLVAGERRWRACQLLGWDTIPAMVRDDLSPEQVSAIMLAENTARADLDPVEEARAYQSRIDAGWTVARLSETAGVSAQRINARTRLLSLREDLQALVRSGDLQIGYAQTLAAAGLDTNRQMIAVRRLQANPAPTVSWFRTQCGELANEQAQEPMTGFWLEQVEPAPVAKIQLPPSPRTHKAPMTGDSYNQILANQIRFWTDAAAAWDALGKGAKRDECLSAAEVLQGALEMMAASVRQPDPITQEVDLSDLYSTQQAADYLGIALPTLKHHVKRGNIIPTKIGKTLVFTQEQLDEFKAVERRPGNPAWRKS